MARCLVRFALIIGSPMTSVGGSCVMVYCALQHEPVVRIDLANDNLASVGRVACSPMIGVKGRGPDRGKPILAKWFLSSRLETRTEECNV